MIITLVSACSFFSVNCSFDSFFGIYLTSYFHLHSVTFNIQDKDNFICSPASNDTDTDCATKNT